MESREPPRATLTLPRWLAPVAVLGLALAEAARRLLGRGLPTDTSAYVAAAQTFAAGRDPYGVAIFDAPAWQGFPFVYCPAALWLLLPLARAPRAALLLGDLALRAGLAWWTAGQLRRQLALARISTWELLLLALLCEPFVTDLMAGNLALHMLAALLAALRLGQRGGAPAQLGGGVGLGVALSLKPMWGVATGFAVLRQRRGWVVCGLLAGAGAMLALSLAQGTLVASWLRRLAEVRAIYRTVDAWALSPLLLAALALAWGGVAAWLLRRPPAAGDRSWLWGCASIVAWPRLHSYSYLALAPVLVAAGGALGLGPALLLATPLVGPLPWILGEPWAARLRYAWALPLAVGLAVRLGRGPDADAAPG